MADLKQLIQEYLQEAKLMQLATAKANQPWVCTVWFAVDEAMHIYWFSSTTRRHSAEVLENAKVAGAMALPHMPEDPPRGLQFEGIAEKLTKPEDIAKAVAVYKDRIFSQETIDELLNNPEKPHAFYRIKPTVFVLFDAIHFVDNWRQEYIVTNE